MTNENHSDSPTRISRGKHRPQGFISLDQLTIWYSARRTNEDLDGCTMSVGPLLSKTNPWTPLGLPYMVHSTATIMKKEDSRRLPYRQELFQETPTPLLKTIPIASMPSQQQAPVRRRRRTIKHTCLPYSKNINNTLGHCPLLIETCLLPLLGDRSRAIAPLDSIKGQPMSRLPDDKDRQTRSALVATSRGLPESMALIPSIHNPSGSTSAV
jgi:hypothetical protein